MAGNGFARAILSSFLDSFTKLSMDVSVIIASGFCIKAYFVVIFSKAILLALPKPQLFVSKISSISEFG